MPKKSVEIKAITHKGGWFRMYADLLNDPKVQLLPDRLFKFWVNCLALTSEHRGYLPNAREIAFRLRLSMTEAEDDLANLMTHGLIESVTVNGKTAFQPHNWFGRQPPSYHSTERVRKFRRNGNETKRNVSVTADETNETYSQSQSVLQEDTELSIQEDSCTSVVGADASVMHHAGRSERIYRNNRSGYPGVSRHKQTGRWQALIGYHGTQYHVGLFDTPEAAYEAYIAVCDDPLSLPAIADDVIGGGA